MLRSRRGDVCMAMCRLEAVPRMTQRARRRIYSGGLAGGAKRHNVRPGRRGRLPVVDDVADAGLDAVTIGSRDIPVWPAGQRVESFAHPEILVTFFADADAVHSGLLARLRALEQDRRLASKPVPAFGGTKVYHLDQWNCPEADLLNARA